MKSISSLRIASLTVLTASVIVLSIAVTYAQVSSLGIHFIRVQQEKVHLEMMQGNAGNPWQYRILADALIDPLIKLVKGLGVPQPESFTFIGFRFLQCIFVLVAAGVYYRRLGLSFYESLIGLSILAWSMSFSLYNSDLSFNVFFDVAFYLLAAILILDRKYLWLVLLMVPAALNRETSILIPFMLFFATGKNPGNEEGRARRLIAPAVALAIFVIVFVGLRLYYGPQQFLTADGYFPGIGLLLLNLKRAVTWEQLAITLGIIPVLALCTFRAWPRTLRIFFWVVVPVWIVVHSGAALVAETRLLLVPQALVFIPGALSELMSTRRAATQDATTVTS